MRVLIFILLILPFGVVVDSELQREALLESLELVDRIIDLASFYFLPISLGRFVTALFRSEIHRNVDYHTASQNLINQLAGLSKKIDNLAFNMEHKFDKLKTIVEKVLLAHELSLIVDKIDKRYKKLKKMIDSESINNSYVATEFYEEVLNTNSHLNMLDEMHSHYLRLSSSLIANGYLKSISDYLAVSLC